MLCNKLISLVEWDRPEVYGIIPVLFRHLIRGANEPCGIPSNHGMRGEAVCYHRACADPRSFTQLDIRGESNVLVNVDPFSAVVKDQVSAELAKPPCAENDSCAGHGQALPDPNIQHSANKAFHSPQLSIVPLYSSERTDSKPYMAVSVSI